MWLAADVFIFAIRRKRARGYCCCARPYRPASRAGENARICMMLRRDVCCLCCHWWWWRRFEMYERIRVRGWQHTFNLLCTLCVCTCACVCVCVGCHCMGIDFSVQLITSVCVREGMLTVCMWEHLHNYIHILIKRHTVFALSGHPRLICVVDDVNRLHFYVHAVHNNNRVQLLSGYLIFRPMRKHHGRRRRSPNH